MRAESFVKATEILEVLMNERDTSASRADAARVSLRIHRDHLKASRGAEKAVTKLLEELPSDGEGIDLILATEIEPQLRKRLFLASQGALLGQLRAKDALADSPTEESAHRRRENRHIFHVGCGKQDYGRDCGRYLRYPEQFKRDENVALLQGQRRHRENERDGQPGGDCRIGC